MKKILEEIRSQPLWLRQLMFAFCMITTVAVVGIKWVNSTEETLISLINTPDRIEESQYAKEHKTIFARIGDTANDLVGSISNFIFSDEGEVKIESDVKKTPATRNNTYLLPLSDKK
jgi:hypothetical protein